MRQLLFSLLGVGALVILAQTPSLAQNYGNPANSNAGSSMSDTASSMSTSVDFNAYNYEQKDQLVDALKSQKSGIDDRIDQVKKQSMDDQSKKAEIDRLKASKTQLDSIISTVKGASKESWDTVKDSASKMYKALNL